MAAPLLIAKNAGTSLELLPALANRHGQLGPISDAERQAILRSSGSELGRQVLRGILGSVLGTTKRRR